MYVCIYVFMYSCNMHVCMHDVCTYFSLQYAVSIGLRTILLTWLQLDFGASSVNALCIIEAATYKYGLQLWQLAK